MATRRKKTATRGGQPTESTNAADETEARRTSPRTKKIATRKTASRATSARSGDEARDDEETPRKRAKSAKKSTTKGTSRKTTGTTATSTVTTRKRRAKAEAAASDDRAVSTRRKPDDLDDDTRPRAKARGSRAARDDRDDDRPASGRATAKKRSSRSTESRRDLEGNGFDDRTFDDRDRDDRDRDDRERDDRDRDEQTTRSRSRRGRGGRGRTAADRDDRDDRGTDRDDDYDRNGASGRSKSTRKKAGARSKKSSRQEDQQDGKRASTRGKGKSTRKKASGSSARSQQSDKSPGRSSSRKKSSRQTSTRSRGGKPARPAADSSAVNSRRYAPGEGKAGRRILISTREDQESRVAVVAESRLEEFYVDRAGEDTHVGNVYLGKVVNLEPSIGAAFIDYGEGKNGFLHASDVMPSDGESRVQDFLAMSEDGGTAPPARRPDERKNIDELLKLGEEVVVQVTKQGIGQKGATLTTYVSIPGCYLVLMPNLRRTGVSRKIADGEERRRLREILDGLELPEGLGFIIRTAGEDHPRQDLERDAQFLLKMWNVIAKRLAGARAPASLYRESDLILRSVRDLFTPDTVEVVVDTERHHKRCLDFMKHIMPQYADRVRLHDKPKPLFTEFSLDSEVEKVYQRKVQLKSGGSIVIDQTEALVAIDVNSGKNKEEADLEETALKTNLETIPEIVRQLRLRDLGGLVIIDFIDMMEERHRRRVERALRDELRKDRARFRMEGISMFGIVELTRQRVRPSLFAAATSPCPACHGLGTVKKADSVSHTILRRIRGEMTRPHCGEIEVRLFPEMATFVQNARRQVLLEMEDQFNKVIRITPDAMLRYDELRLAYHERVRDLSLDLEHYL